MNKKEILKLKPNDIIDFMFEGGRQTGQIIWINDDHTKFNVIDPCGWQISVSNKDLRPSSIKNKL